MKKIILLFCVLIFSTFGQTTQVKNFDDLLTRLVNGSNVKIVIKYAMTKLVINGNEEDAPDAIGGMELSTYEYFGRGVVQNDMAFIACSKTVLINHPFYGYVYNYVKIRIYDDNSAEIQVEYLDPKTYEVKMDEKFFAIINNGENEGGIYFYND